MYPRAHRLHSGAILSFSQDIQLLYNNAIGWLQHCQNFRPLHSKSVAAVEKGHRHELVSHGLEPQPTKRRKYVELHREETKDIITNDLSATIEAHRATNKASLVRRFNVDLEYLPTAFIRPSRFQYLHKCYRGAAPVDDIVKDQDIGDAPQNLSRVRKGIKGKQKLNIQRRKQMQGCRRKGMELTPCQGSPDYKGLDLKPSQHWERKSLDKRQQSPWLALVASTEGDGLARLRDEIKAFEDYMSLKPHDMMAFRTLDVELKSIVEKVVSSSSMHLIGSYSTGLATPTSDLDFRLSLLAHEKEPLTRGPSPSRPEARKAGVRALKKLEKAMKKSPSYGHVEYVRARFNIVRAVHCPTKIPVQIQATFTQPASIPYSVTYLSEFPTLRPLYILLRSALQMRGLNTVFKGGVGSYPLLIMIVYALKRCSSDFPRHDIANQLLYTLKLYHETNLYKNGFSLNPAPVVFDKWKSGNKGIDELPQPNPDRQRYLLCLQDPADPTNDLGRRSHMIKHVQEVFKAARREIKIAMQRWELMSRSEREGLTKGGFCLQPLVGADYTHFEAGRRRLEKSMQKAVMAKYDQP